MPKFSIDPSGVDAINGGIGSIFKALAQAPLVQQQAAQQAALRSAQAYHANMSGNKDGATAEGLQMTNDYRRGVDDMIAADAGMSPYQKSLLTSFKLIGPGHLADYARAGGELQKQQAIADIQAGADPLKTGQGYAAVSGKMPFDAVGNTGRFFNGLTGQGGVSESTLSKIYDNEAASRIGEHRAREAKSYSGIAVDRAHIDKLNVEQDKIKSGLPTVIGYDAQGNPITDAPEPKLTEMQGKATLFATRMRDATVALNDLEGKVTPMQVAMASNLATNAIAPADAQMYRQAQENWVTANLRLESGAAIPPKEMEQEILKWFPRVGDGEKVIQQKAAARKVAEEGMVTLSGPGKPLIERNLKNGGSAAAGGGKQAGPKPGAVEGGYRFKGGNPADPNAWEKL